jgi:hypothetical protein
MCLRFRLPFMLCMATILALASCASPREAGEEGERSRRVAAAPAAPGPVDLQLAPDDVHVRTVLLHRTGHEVEMPILRLNGTQTLTLAFDLIEGDPRPVSVYFYHADRHWRRDLVAAEFLTRFQRDDILSYESSRGTQVPYVHYRYRFPNDAIGFQISGNYIIRVTEQGDEDAVLFERPFLVSETGSQLDMNVDHIMMGQRFAGAQPMARLVPSERSTNAFDYQACFIRNGQWQSMRCVDRPNLADMPALGFYLEPHMAFESDPGDFFLDLSALRVGSRLLGIDRTTTPFEARLERDEARFPGTPHAPQLGGQPAVSSAVRDVAEPGSGAEYVLVHFAFVPPDRRSLDGRVYVVGSFTNWQRREDQRMRWNAVAGQYDASVLIKQGQYEYRYAGGGGRVERLMREALPRTDQVFLGLAYYRDLLLNTDRLVAVETVRGF